MSITIRSMNTTDVKEIAELSSQLGYEISVENTLENIKTLSTTPNSVGLVAIIEKKIVGWMTVSKVFQIESLPCCEVRGLVVDKNFRRQGIGQLLIESAKTWSREHGNNRVEIKM